jgi:hypothetical protein
MFFVDAARKRGISFPHFIGSKKSWSGPRPVATTIPNWFQSQMGSELKMVLDSGKPVYLFLPWIAEHGDTLMSRIASDDADFMFAALDLWPPSEDNVLRKTVNAFARDNPHLYRKMVVRRLVPLRGRIKGFVLSFDWAPVTRIIANVCEELEIPRILIPHESVFIDREKFYWHPDVQSSVPTADIILGWGDLQREVFCDRGYPAERFIAVGAPKFDPYNDFKPQLTRLQFCRLFGLDPDRKIVLFAAQPLDSQIDVSLARISQRNAVNDIFKHVKMEGAQLLVRLPPSKDEVLSVGIRQKLAESPFAAVDDAKCYLVGPEEALYHADVVTSINSTMLLEAIVLGKPALALCYVEFEQTWEKAGVPVVKSCEQLDDVLSQILTGAWHQSPDGLKWAASKFGVGAFDGKATARIREHLNIIAKKGLLPYPNAVERVLMGQSVDVMAMPGSKGSDTTQRYLLQLLKARTRVSSAEGLGYAETIAGADLFVQWGITPSRVKRQQFAAARALGRPLLIVEDGFIRSVDIGLSGTPGLSVILDDTTAYYDATRPSRLQRLLESGPELTPEETNRSGRAINRIVVNRVSKYNHAPDLDLKIGDPGRRKVLLVDQRFGDQSIESGLADEDSFERMLQFAVSERSDWDIIVKQHPDAIKGGKSSYFSEERLKPHMQVMQNIHPVLFDVNPYGLFDLVDEVFVVTSGMGFEALMAGKTVHCFGAPYYAGWGATVDHLPIPGRTRRRGVEELFHFSYIVSSRYYHPDRQEVVEVEELVDYIVKERGWIADKMPADLLPLASQKVAASA